MVGWTCFSLPTFVSAFLVVLFPFWSLEMRTSGEYMDKRIMELSRSRPNDFYDHAGIHLHGDSSDDDDDDSHSFSLHPTKGSHHNSITEKEWIRFNEALLSLIEKKMKESKEEVLHAVEGISARLSQLETRARRLENSVDELKESVEFNQAKTDGKLGELESLVREVQDCTKDIRDKQDIALAQVELVKLRLNSQERDGKQGGTTRACPTEINSSAASGIQTQPLSQQPPSPSFHSDVPYTPPLVNPLPALSTAALQLPIPLNNCNPFLSCDNVPCRPPAFTLENTNQPFLVLPPPPPPPALQPLPPPPMLPSESVRYWPGEFSHMPPQSYQESFHPPFVSPLVSPLSHPVQGQPFENPFPERSGTYLQPPEVANYSGGNFPVPIQNFQDSHSSSTLDSSGSHPKLQVARVLPHALPTASFIDSESPRHETGNGVPPEDVVDKVVSMGFRRDVVASTVKRLRERGQPLNLNVVLDRMMNSRDPINMHQRTMQ